MNGTKTIGEKGIPRWCITKACPDSCTAIRPTILLTQIENVRNIKIGLELDC